VFSNFFFSRKSCRLWDNVKKYCRAGQAIDDNMAHAHCMLDTWGYKYTHKLCNTHCFPTATTVARTHLNVTLYVHCLSCSSFWNNSSINLNCVKSPLILHNLFHFVHTSDMCKFWRWNIYNWTSPSLFSTSPCSTSPGVKFRPGLRLNKHFSISGKLITKGDCYLRYVCLYFYAFAWNRVTSTRPMFLK